MNDYFWEESEEQWLRDHWDTWETIEEITEVFNSVPSFKKRTTSSLQSKAKYMGLIHKSSGFCLKTSVKTLYQKRAKRENPVYSKEEDEWLISQAPTIPSHKALYEAYKKQFPQSTKTFNGVTQRFSKGLGLKLSSYSPKKSYLYSEEETQWMIENHEKYETYKEFWEAFHEVQGFRPKSISSFKEKCSKRLGIHKKNPTVYGIKPKEQLPVGTIRKSSTGVYIKVKDIPLDEDFGLSGYSEPYWKPIQKKIYEDAYGELEQGMMVCFLDGNHDNLSLDNLYPINRKISAHMSSNSWWSSNKDITLTAIKYCELIFALKR